MERTVGPVLAFRQLARHPALIGSKLDIFKLFCRDGCSISILADANLTDQIALLQFRVITLPYI